MLDRKDGPRGGAPAGSGDAAVLVADPVGFLGGFSGKASTTTP